MNENNNSINPNHYRFGAVEAVEIAQQLSFLCGNAFKYICRAGRKDPTKEVEDLQKAVKCLEMERDRIMAINNDEDYCDLTEALIIYEDDYLKLETIASHLFYLRGKALDLIVDVFKDNKFHAESRLCEAIDFIEQEIKRLKD